MNGSYEEIELESENSIENKIRGNLVAIIEHEIAEELDELDMEAQYRNVTHYSIRQITGSRKPLRYIRRLLQREDLLLLPVSLLRILPESAGYLDQPISPADAAALLRVVSSIDDGFALQALNDPAIIERPVESAEVEKPMLGESRKNRHPEIPAVSRAALQKWFEAYSQRPDYPTYTEQKVLGDARTNFSAKKISRERIRELRGPQKRGPKRFSGKQAAKLPPK